MKLKVCGMKYLENIQAISKLEVDYLGFIFYEKSARNFDGQIPKLPASIQKVAVFVNEHQNVIIEKVKTFGFDAVQLHGEESVEYIRTLKRKLADVKILKAFAMHDYFDFSVLPPYQAVVDYFLFDTKGTQKGGNGYTFDWRILEQYRLDKPYFLSGGIGLENVRNLANFLKTDMARYCHAIDVNSKFELKPGLKKTIDVNLFIQELKTI